MEIDHIVVVAASLEEGDAAVRAALGIGTEPGGTHPAMGTHNRLLSLGPAYLEVIAVDPAALAPDRPRWFGLDDHAGGPRLAHWVARPSDMTRALAEAPLGMGDLTEMSRGGLEWRITVPPSGAPPFDGVVPALIAWRRARAAARLPDRGLALQRLRLSHPRMGEIRAAWPRLAETPGLVLEVGPQAELSAEIATPDGLKTIPGALG